jgi:hypothetical protein
MTDAYCWQPVDDSLAHMRSENEEMGLCQQQRDVETTKEYKFEKREGK